MDTAQTTFAEVELPEVTWPEVTSVTWPEEAMTGSDVTIRHVVGRGPDWKWPKYVLRMPGVSRAFPLTMVVVQVTSLPEVSKGHVSPSGFPWVCTWASGSCEMSSLVGPFDRKWRYETSPVVTAGPVSPSGFPWVRACVIESALGVFSTTLCPTVRGNNSVSEGITL